MKRLLLFILFFFLVNSGISQNLNKYNIEGRSSEMNNHLIGINDSTSVWILPRITKNLELVVFLNTKNGVPDKKWQVSKSEPILEIHGNVLYNFSYRSYLDTPFAQTGLVQHQILTTLHATVKDKYPIQMQVGVRNSNAHFFKNSVEVNITYHHRQLMDKLKDDLRNRLTADLALESISESENLYRQHLQQARELQAWINNPARAQEIIEEKEQRLTSGKSMAIVSSTLSRNIPAASFNELQNPENSLKKSIENNNRQENLWTSFQQKFGATSKRARSEFFHTGQDKDLTNKDTNSISTKIKTKKEALNKLQEIIKDGETKIRESKKAARDTLNNLKREINSLTTTASLYEFMSRQGLSKDSLTKAQKLLLSVNQFGIGRIFLDYSELTVKNLSLTGVSLEANPNKFYFALAGGKINYRFRDFILKNEDRLPPQSIYIIRAGIGNKERNNVIFSFYNGNKNELRPSQDSVARPAKKVLGISAETRWALDANNFIIAEVAKSSYTPSGPGQVNSDLLNKAFDLKTHTNVAYSIKLFSQSPTTNTRLSTFYRKMGENFQSFNLYPSQVNEEAWMVKVNQYFWRRKLNIEAAVRKNNFESPVATPASYSAKTIFKSVQATLRIRKYPFVSIGYYPTSQLSFTSHSRLIENQYNTLNAVVSHSYQIKKMPMNSTAVFTQFFNNSTDTGFIYFNAKTFSFNHSVFLAAFTSQSGASLTDQKNIDLVTLEQTMSYRIKQHFSLSAGVKWNRLNRDQNLWGGTAGMSFFIKKIGTFLFNYDKTFLPGYNRLLMPVDMGRMSFYKVF